MGFIGKIINGAADVALDKVKDKIINPKLETIGTVESLTYKDKKLYMTVILEGMEDKPIDVCAEEIEISPDCASVKVNKFSSNMAFVNNALNKYATCPFSVPDGAGRTVLKTVKPILGL